MDLVESANFNKSTSKLDTIALEDFNILSYISEEKRRTSSEKLAN